MYGGKETSIASVLLALTLVNVSGTFSTVEAATGGTCTARNCHLPDCFCAGHTGPASVPVDQTPQMVMLSFDDAVLPEFEQLYRQIFADGRRRNPNGCPIAATFYVTHNSTDYGFVGRLHSAGHEVASHSVSHRLPQSNWTHASRDQWTAEIAGQRDNLALLAGIPPRSIRGMRAPFLETGGDIQFRMLSDEGFDYDSSFMVSPNPTGGVWPFTVDFPPSVEFCTNNNCPKSPHAGIWELPLNRWVGHDGRACAMVDSCDVQPTGKGDALSYFWFNFGRFYRGNRAPFGVHMHADWFTGSDEYLAAFETFVDALLADMDDVYFVTASQVIEWMRDPQTVEQASNFQPWKTSCADGVALPSLATVRSKDSTGQSKEKDDVEELDDDEDEDEETANEAYTQMPAATGMSTASVTTSAAAAATTAQQHSQHVEFDEDRIGVVPVFWDGRNIPIWHGYRDHALPVASYVVSEPVHELPSSSLPLPLLPVPLPSGQSSTMRHHQIGIESTFRVDFAPTPTTTTLSVDRGVSFVDHHNGAEIIDGQTIPPAVSLNTPRSNYKSQPSDVDSVVSKNVASDNVETRLTSGNAEALHDGQQPQLAETASAVNSAASSRAVVGGIRLGFFVALVAFSCRLL